MEYRELGRTGWKVSAISTGTWAMGSLWGNVSDSESMAALNRSLDLGVNFFDTSDAYGSEHLLGQLKRARKAPFYIATKMGMGVNPDPRGYTKRNLTAFTENSLRQLGVETIDLMQLHCPPLAAYNAETFGILDDLVKQGKIRFYGASVERLAEAKKAIEFPNLQSIMLVFNMFKQQPIDDFFPQAKARKVGIIARVPLASGLLSGKMNRSTTFARDDHRSFNRDGQAFDKGETFSGVDFETGLKAVEELRPLVPAGSSMAEMALRWILMFPEVTCAIPGAKRPSQAEDNVHAVDMPALPDKTMKQVREIFDRNVRAQVARVW